MTVHNILVVDDNSSPREIAYALEARGYKVQACQDLCQAEYYASNAHVSTGGEPFDALILDLTMDATYLPEELWAEARMFYSGWVFYERILKELNPGLYNRTILYTAFGDQLKEKIGEDRYKKLRVLSKTNNDMMQIADDWLKSFDVTK